MPNSTTVNAKMRDGDDMGVKEMLTRIAVTRASPHHRNTRAKLLFQLPPPAPIGLCVGQSVRSRYPVFLYSLLLYAPRTPRKATEWGRDAHQPNPQ